MPARSALCLLVSLPDRLLPEFPPPIDLTTRPDLGDVSKGQLVTLANFETLFKDVLNPKQLEGLRLLVTPFPQAQFNAIDDRRARTAHQGVACLDCHANGHTTAATHTVGDIRPNEHRHRIDTPSLRGVNVQRLFGSQRAMKTVEDFTEFEQRAAYFDGDPAQAQRKGVNILERGSQVHFMAEMENLFDFPPAPKLDVFGKLDRSQASEAELRGEALFEGKARCATCHPAPDFTDNQMHNLRVERFFEPVLINGRMASADGPIKTFPLRGIKDSPPYLHDDRLLTLEDTVEFFNWSSARSSRRRRRRTSSRICVRSDPALGTRSPGGLPTGIRARHHPRCGPRSVAQRRHPSAERLATGMHPDRAG